ncbi:DUF1778 domain-containing protein [Rhizobium panacihumi]|uniref:type II toxin-antitoxin system TacA family antitoxin n=1 Tax=Rhizobium panacihumi TaxID=2008450 RepID=UPI003D7953C7
MFAFKDATSEIDEPNDARMNFRTKPRIKDAIQRAAALSGMDDSAFTINAAYRSALETIAAHETTRLKSVDHAAFFDALDNPAAPTANLKNAFERHRKSVIAK